MIQLTRLFFALSLFLCLTSCGSDDDVTASSNDVQGTWSAISFVAEIQSTTTFGGDVFTSTSNVEGSNLDYDVTFETSTYTTNGSYDMTITTAVSGSNQTSNQTYTDVSGSGTYSTSGNVMTIDGSFFDIEVDGMNVTLENGEQMADYEINSNGNLVFSQNETTTDNTNGVTSTTTIISTSVWERN